MRRGPAGSTGRTSRTRSACFEGSLVVPLPLVSGEGMLAYDRLFRPAEGSGSPLDGPSLGLFFELSLGLSAWKEYGPSRWALRNNPSSGNLHPTEGYLVLSTDIDAELVAGVYHYLPHEHALERRCRFAGEVLATISAAVAPGGTLVGLSSVHWREAWKYGERAFRYCQHDAGHAIGSLRLAARVLGWRLRVLPSPSDALAAALLGLDRRDDFAGAEPEHADGLMLLDPTGGAVADIELGEELAAVVGRAAWFGRANLLSPAHVPWRAMQGVAEAAAKPKNRSAAGRHMQPTCAPVALVDAATEPARRCGAHHPPAAERRRHGRPHPNDARELLPHARPHHARSRPAAVGCMALARSRLPRPVRAPGRRIRPRALPACPSAGEARLLPRNRKRRLARLAAGRGLSLAALGADAGRRPAGHGGADQLQPGDRGRWRLQPRHARRPRPQSCQGRPLDLPAPLLGVRAARSGSLPGGRGARGARHRDRLLLRRPDAPGV